MMISGNRDEPNDLLTIENTFSLEKPILTITLDDSDEEDQEIPCPSPEPFTDFIKNEESSWNQPPFIKNEGYQTNNHMTSEQIPQQVSSAHPETLKHHYFGLMKREDYGSSFMENDDKNQMMINNLDMIDNHSHQNQFFHSIDQKLDLMKKETGWVRKPNFNVFGECMETPHKTEPSAFASAPSNLSEICANEQSFYGNHQIINPEYKTSYDKVMKDEEFTLKSLLESHSNKTLTDEEHPGFPNYLTDKSKHFNFQKEENQVLKSILNGNTGSFGGRKFPNLKVGHKEESHQERAIGHYYFTPMTRDNGPLDLTTKYCPVCLRYTNDVLPHKSGCQRNCAHHPSYTSYVTKTTQKKIMDPSEYSPPTPAYPPNIPRFSYGEYPLHQPSNIVYFNAPTSTLNDSYETKMNINWRNDIQSSHYEQRAENLEGELFEIQGRNYSPDIKDDDSLGRSGSTLSSNKRNADLGVRKNLHSCLFCPKTFASKTQLNGHTLYKCANKKIICTICSTRFTTNTHLMRHQESQMCTKKLFECKTCHNRYKNASSLRGHSSKCGDHK